MIIKILLRCSHKPIMCMLFYFILYDEVVFFHSFHMSIISSSHYPLMCNVACCAVYRAMLGGTFIGTSTNMICHLIHTHMLLSKETYTRTHLIYRCCHKQSCEAYLKHIYVLVGYNMSNLIYSIPTCKPR